MPPRGRPRIERAVSAGAPETADALTQLRDAFPSLMNEWIEKSKDNPQMATTLVRLMENDILRAQRGQADALLQRIQAIRRQASPIQSRIWNQAVRDIAKAGMTVITSE